MIETVHTFGAEESLIGIVTEPEAGTPGRPAVVLLNSGLLPRTGTFRLHVILARALARLGFLVLRFDLAGIGDSLQHLDGRSHAEQVAGDIQDAMDYLASVYQHDSFVLAGLCTGADNAHKAAVADPRVVGAVFIEGYVYPTMGYYIRRYIPRFFKLTPLLNRLRCLLKTVTMADAKRVDDHAHILDYGWELPPKEQTEKDLMVLVRREVQLLYFFCGTNSGFQYGNQIKDAFRAIDFRGRLQVCYLPEASHTFMFMKSRDQFIHLLGAWMKSCFGSAP